MNEDKDAKIRVAEALRQSQRKKNRSEQMTKDDMANRAALLDRAREGAVRQVADGDEYDFLRNTREGTQVWRNRYDGRLLMVFYVVPKGKDGKPMPQEAGFRVRAVGVDLQYQRRADKPERPELPEPEITAEEAKAAYAAQIATLVETAVATVEVDKTARKKPRGKKQLPDVALTVERPDGSVDES